MTEKLLLLGDSELAWTGTGETNQFLLYYCAFWNPDGVGGLAVHEFDRAGTSLSLEFIPIRKLSRRDMIGDIQRCIEEHTAGILGFSIGPIQVAPFVVEVDAMKKTSMVANAQGDGILLPRELRFDQQKGGSVVIDFELKIPRT